MFSLRKFLAAFSVTHGLLSAVVGQTIPGELVVSQPTLAAVEDGAPVNEAAPLVSVVRRFDRVNNEATSPITLAPDPDYPIQLTADRRVLSAPLQRFRRVLTGYSCANGQCTPQYRYEAIPATPAPAAAPPQAAVTVQRQSVSVRRFGPVRRLLHR